LPDFYGRLFASRRRGGALRKLAVSTPYSDAQAVSARLPAQLEADFRLMLPLVRLINGVLGLKAAELR